MKQTHLLAYLTILLVNAFWLGLGYYWSYTHFIERDVFLPHLPGYNILFYLSLSVSFILLCKITQRKIIQLIMAPLISFLLGILSWGAARLFAFNGLSNMLHDYQHGGFIELITHNIILSSAITLHVIVGSLSMVCCCVIISYMMKTQKPPLAN